MNNVLQTTLALFLFFPAAHAGYIYSAGSDSLAETHSGVQARQPKKERLKTFERSFRPSFYDTEVYLYKKTDTTKSFGRLIDNVTAALPETLQGFRIQLIATTNYDEALSVKNEINKAYPDLWIYTVFEAPSYKVRVGDFTSRAEAKPMLDKFKSEGFKTAWIVPDKIIRNQLPKPPLPPPIDSTTVR